MNFWGNSTKFQNCWAKKKQISCKKALYNLKNMFQLPSPLSKSRLGTPRTEDRWGANLPLPAELVLFVTSGGRDACKTTHKNQRKNVS